MKLKELFEEQEKIFVLIVGGAGSGKNFHYENVYKSKGYVLVDVDVLKQEDGTSSAIAQIKHRLEEQFKLGVNVVNPGTGANLKAVENKIKLAKEYGYLVTLVFIDTDLEKAKGYVKSRHQSGGHDVPEYKIEKTHALCRQNIEVLQHQVDFFKSINN